MTNLKKDTPLSAKRLNSFIRSLTNQLLFLILIQSHNSKFNNNLLNNNSHLLKSLINSL